jgi:hypothetical protein
MNYNSVALSVYHGGTIKQYCNGCNYEGRRSNVFHANPEIRFGDFKTNIYSLTGWSESIYDLGINARWQAGQGGRMYFVLISIIDDDF